MRKFKFDSGVAEPRAAVSRRGQRVALAGEVVLRRSAQLKYQVAVYDVSPHGCRLGFVERPNLDERVWVKFEGLEALEAAVCWVSGFVAGVEFARPIHPAVFDLLVARLRQASSG